MAYKKKLYDFRPDRVFAQTQRTRRKIRSEPSAPTDIERGVRQRLADKTAGTLVGLWLLVPEHLRLGTWDLLQGWSGAGGETLAPRLAWQLVHEAALCRTGVRRQRSLQLKGFELLNGLPFIATDQEVHKLLNAHTVADAQALQIALGKIRLASGHFAGRKLAIDPHHLRSYTKRHVRHHRHKPNERAVKTAQTYFCLDVETRQPVAFTLATSDKSVRLGGPELLDLADRILGSQDQPILVMADKEHFCAELFQDAIRREHFTLVVPIPNTAAQKRRLAAIPPDEFQPHWAGFYTAKRNYQFKNRPDLTGLMQIIQRTGEGSQMTNKGFLANRDLEEVQTLLDDYPDRWHVEEFFRDYQALGWKRAGTQNLNIRYGQMTMALLAQAAIHQLRERLGEPYNTWNAEHFANSLFEGLEGDIRVVDDRIVVTYYNAPNAQRWRHHYEDLPRKMKAEGLDPRIPWLYNFKLDFRFK